MSRVVKIGDFRFGEELFRLRYVVEREEVRFVAKDIAKALKYEKPANAITKHVDEKYKSVFEQGPRFGDSTQNACETVAKRGDSLYLQPHTILLTKSGVIQLIMKSKLPYAVELQEWLLEEVIPQVLCTGKYQPAVAMDLDNERLAGMIDTMKAENAKKDALVAKLTARIDAVTKYKDHQISRIMADLNRMYTGFQATMQRKDEIMAKRDEILMKKDEQVTLMLNKMVELSSRAVQYPTDVNKLPVLCVVQNGTAFRAIAGQRSYVDSQKHKCGIDRDSVVVELTRPNPIVDWNNAMEAVSRNYTKGSVKRSKRSLLFESRDDAQKFLSDLKQMLGIVAAVVVDKDGDDCDKTTSGRIDSGTRVAV